MVRVTGRSQINLLSRCTFHRHAHMRMQAETRGHSDPDPILRAHLRRRRGVEEVDRHAPLDAAAGVAAAVDEATHDAGLRTGGGGRGGGACLSRPSSHMRSIAPLAPLSAQVRACARKRSAAPPPPPIRHRTWCLSDDSRDEARVRERRSKWSMWRPAVATTSVSGPAVAVGRGECQGASHERAEGGGGAPNQAPHAARREKEKGRAGRRS